MTKQTKACRVCGTQFVPCARTLSNAGMFNYREVACSPNCGAIYLERIDASRKKNPSIKAVDMVKEDLAKMDAETSEKKTTKKRRRKPTPLPTVIEPEAEVAQESSVLDTSERIDEPSQSVGNDETLWFDGV